MLVVCRGRRPGGGGALAAITVGMAALVLGVVMAWLRWPPRAGAVFYPDGDITDCNVVPAVGVFIKELPPNGGSIMYNVADVVGEDASLIFRTHLKDYVDTRLGRARRLGAATYVAAPPETQIALGFWAYNFSGVPVDIKRIYVPLSAPGYGALTDIATVPSTVYKHIDFKYNGLILSRPGYYMEFPRSLTVPNKQLLPGIELGVVTIKRPVSASIRDLECSLLPGGGARAVAKVCFKLNTHETLKVQITDPVSRMIPLSPTVREHCDTIVLESESAIFTEPDHSWILPELRYTVPSSAQYCLSVGDTDGDSYNPFSRAVFVARGDITAPPSWTAIQPGFARVNDQGICLKRMSYNVGLALGSCVFTIGLQLVQHNVYNRCATNGQRWDIALSLTTTGVGLRSSQVSICPINFAPESIDIVPSNLDVQSGCYRVAVPPIPQLSSTKVNLTASVSTDTKLGELPDTLVSEVRFNGGVIGNLVLNQCDTPVDLIVESVTATCQQLEIKGKVSAPLIIPHMRIRTKGKASTFSTAKVFVNGRLQSNIQHAADPQNNTAALFFPINARNAVWRVVLEDTDMCALAGRQLILEVLDVNSDVVSRRVVRVPPCVCSNTGGGGSTGGTGGSGSGFGGGYGNGDGLGLSIDHPNNGGSSDVGGGDSNQRTTSDQESTSDNMEASLGDDHLVACIVPSIVQPFPVGFGTGSSLVKSTAMFAHTPGGISAAHLLHNRAPNSGCSTGKDSRFPSSRGGLELLGEDTRSLFLPGDAEIVGNSAYSTSASDPMSGSVSPIVYDVTARQSHWSAGPWVFKGQTIAVWGLWLLENLVLINHLWPVGVLLLLAMSTVVMVKKV